jgi:predicted dehydrogenase
MNSDLNIGLIGAGWAAGQHAASIKAIGGARVAAVFDRDAAAGAALAATVGARTAGNLDDLLSGEVEAVVVSTPSGVHREAVVKALDLGKAVFVEKPLSRSAEDAWVIVEAAERTGIVCAVGYQWRAIDNLGLLERDLNASAPAILVSQGVGITQARSWFTDNRLSGGLIFERVSHHIDLQRKIAGEVRSVSAVNGGVALSGRMPGAETVEDVLSLTMQFANGAVGMIVVGWTPEGYPPTQSLTVHTTAASFDVALDPDFRLTDRSGVQTAAALGELPFRRQMRSFLQAARQQDQSIAHCSARDAAGTVEVALAAAASLAAGGVPQPVGIAR